MADVNRSWRPVTRNHLCPACRRPDWCAYSPDGLLKCERTTDAPAGWELVKLKDGGALFRPESASGDNGRAASCGGRAVRAVGSGSSDRSKPLDWSKESERCRQQLASDRLSPLAESLGVSVGSLETIGAGWATTDDLRRYAASGSGWQERYPDGGYTFPERDGGGRIVGLSLRTTDGRKGFPSSKRGARRGIIVPRALAERSDPVLVVEGASDAAACETLGLATVGRPSCSGGAEQLARLLKGRNVIVVGERDQKPDGSWPGRDGAERVAQRLATDWGNPVSWALPPEGVNDVREWIQSKQDNGPLTADNESEMRVEILRELVGASTEVEKEKRPPQSELLVKLALERYRIGVSDTGEPFVVEHGGPNLAILFRGSRDALRSVLARDYRRLYGTTPCSTGLTDALTALDGEAMDRTPEPVHLRIAEHDSGVVIDLGGEDGRTVIVRPDGWQLVDESPVLFRRTALTGALPEPEPGGDLSSLRDLLNVSGETWPVVLGWLVASIFPDVAHPILLLGGQQGAGKTTAARMLVGLFDPSPAPLRSQPRDVEQWAVSAAGSWGVVMDNISFIAGWWSDALCRAVSGDGLVRRKLYTDSELSVLSFRRVIALTSIDPGALRGDLGDRLIMADLEPIDELKRRTEADLESVYAAARPYILGALLDLVANVMAALPGIALDRLPRMADFGQILAAVDSVLGTQSLDLYIGQRNRIAQDVVESDPLGELIAKLVEEVGPWAGTAGELLQRITPETKPTGWPKSARAMAGRLRRLVPALREIGVEVVIPNPTDKRRQYKLQRTAQTAQPPENGSDGQENGDSRRAVEQAEPPNSPADRPAKNGTDAVKNGDSGRSGDLGGMEPLLSGSTDRLACFRK